MINKIKLKKPDAVYAIVVGGSNVSFYKQLKAAGVTADKQTLLTISVTEDELLGIGGENMVGFYAAMKYFQSLRQRRTTRSSCKAFKGKYGDKSVIGDVTQAGLPRPLAVEGGGREGRQLRRRQGGRGLAGHRAQDARPRATSRSTTITTCGASCASVRCEADGQFKVLYESPLIEPNPFPKGYQ